MQIAALEVPCFALLLSLSDHDIIKARGSCGVSMLHSQRWSKSFVLSLKEQTQASAFSRLFEGSRVLQDPGVQGYWATLCVCCFRQGYACKLGTTEDAAGTGPFGPSSLLSCPVQFPGLIQAALAGSDLGVLISASPAQGIFPSVWVRERL